MENGINPWEKRITGAAGVIGSTASTQDEGCGSNPTAALHEIIVKPIPKIAAKKLLEREHYLHSLPGGTKLSFGIFLNNRLLGAVTFGVGPFLAYRLVKEATPEDCICLTRLWLSDELPSNSESRILGILNRYLHRYTDLKFIIAYSDPSAKHVGTVYQAGGWLYTGLSSSMPLYNVGDGRPRHSRTLAHSLGSHSIRYLSQHGLYVKLVAQLPKHRYIKFLDDSWRCRLLVPVLPYPKREKVVSNEIN